MLSYYNIYKNALGHRFLSRLQKGGTIDQGGIKFAEDFAPIQSPVDELYGSGGTGYENWSVGIGVADDPVLQAFLGLESGQNTFEFLYDPSDPFPGHGGHVPGDGYLPLPGETGDGDDGNVIIVTGQRNTIYLSDLLDLGMTMRDLFPVETLGQPDGSDPGDGGGDDDDKTDDDKDNQCPDGEGGTIQDPGGQGPEVDAAAEKAAAAINELLGLPSILVNFDEYREFGAIVYEDSNGDMQVFGPIEYEPTLDSNGQPAFLTAPLTDAFLAAGLSGESIRGVVHNHPPGVYPQVEINQYPSNTDWTSTSFTSIGASTDNYSLYIIDAYGDVREFSHEMEDHYFRMTIADKRAGKDLPEGTEAGNCASTAGN